MLSTDSPKVSQLTQDDTATSDVWQDADGATQVQLYTAPQNYQPSGSTTFVPIVTTLKADPTAAGRWQSTANTWTASFGSSSAATALVHVTGTAAPLGFTAVGASSVTPSVSGSTATYTGLWPNVNASYVVTTTGVNENLVLTSSAAQSTFDFDLTTTVTAQDGTTTGSLALVSGGQTVATVPPLTVETAQGTTISAAKSGAALTSVADGTGRNGGQVAISVSPSWLAGLPSKDFPVTVDPTATFYGDASSGYTISTSNATNHSEVVAGKALMGGSIYRGVVQFPLTSYLDQSPPWAVVGATLALFAQGGHTSTSTTTSVYLDHTAPGTFAAVKSGSLLASGTGTSTDVINLTTGHRTSPFFEMFNNGSTANEYLGLVGSETRNGTTKLYGTSTDHFDGVYLELTLIQAPVATSVTSPANGSTIPTTTPTVTAPKVTDSAGTVKYDVRISTNADGTGGVVDSGWFAASGTPSWPVPAGSLINGTTYYVRVLTDVSPSLTTPRPPLSVNQFKVTLHLGAGGPSPTDTVGTAPGSTTTPSAGAPSPGTSPASVTVNMVTGDLSFSSSTHSLSTLSGPAGLTLSYNSLEPNQNGLLGQYFHTADGLHDFSATDTLVSQRIDPMVDGSWTTAYPPVGGLNDQPFLVKWTGVVTVPTAGSWKFGVVSRGGGMRVYEGSSSTLVMNDWSGTDTSLTPTFGSTAVTLTAGSHPITVESWNSGTGSTNQLWMKHMGVATTPQNLVPSTWLAPNASILPTGWALSAANLQGGWTGLHDLGTEVVLQGSTGQTASFTKTAPGRYQPPPGYTDLLLTVNSSGTFQLSTPTSQLYTFNHQGTVASVTTVTDDRHPAALIYTYAPTHTGGPLGLSAIKDPVSTRTIHLVYGSTHIGTSTTHCPTPPSGLHNVTGLLCGVNYWDTTQTAFAYFSTGQLAQVTNPDNELIDLAYATTGRVDAIRDPLANDAISAGEEATCPATGTTAKCDTQITYSGGKVATVTQPAPTAGAARPERTYTYTTATRKTTVTIAGFSGTAEVAKYDSQGRITSETTAAGLTTDNLWNADTEPVATIKPDGQETSSVYGLDAQVTDAYGPAPTACFNTTTYLPVATPIGTTGCGVAVPHTHNGYDQGITGLAATYWTNATFAGAPSLHAIVGSADQTWSSPPVTGGKWSARLTGTIDLGTAGTWSVGSETTQTVHVYVSGVPVTASTHGGGGPGTWSASFSSGTVKVTTPGVYPIDVDFSGSGTTTNGFDLRYTAPGGSPVQVPSTALDPNYGLKTSTTTPDGDVTDQSYTNAAGGIGPQDGLVTSTTQNPSGLNLTTTTDYANPNVAATMSPSAGSAISVLTDPDAIAVTPNGTTAYVASFEHSVTPITEVNHTAGRVISVGTNPTAIAITPDGTTAYVANSSSHSVTPITVANNTAGTAISVGTDPDAIAITPNGATAYVANSGSHSVTPITTSSNTAGTAISVGTDPIAIAITPNSATAYVANYSSNSVTPITTSSNTAGTAISVGTHPKSIAITPNGATVYVANKGSHSVTPITVSSNTAGTAISVGTGPTAIAITPNGATAYATNASSSSVTPITTSSNTAGTAISVGTTPTAVAFSQSGGKAYVVNKGSHSVTSITVAAGTAASVVTAGTHPSAMALTPNGTAAFIVNNGSASVTPITIGAPTYLQKTATVLPDGGTTTDSYYSGTAGPLAAVCGIISTTVQGGQLQQQTGPTPGTSGKKRVQQFIYNAEGEQAGVRVGDVSDIASTSWQCTHYDARGRMTSQSWPALGSEPARTVTYTYGVSGHPLVNSVTTNTKTVTSTVDLEGRLVSYTDAWGKTTTTTYNQAGQVTATTGVGGHVQDYYNTAGQLHTVSIDSIYLGSASYCSIYLRTCAGSVDNITFPGFVVGRYSYNKYGQEDQIFYGDTTNGTLFAGDQTSYSLGGRELKDEPVPGGYDTTFTNPRSTGGTDFTYDGAGRLTQAYLPGKKVDYGYAANTSSEGCADSTAGKNTNLTSVVTYPSAGGTATTDYCYNGADQLTKTLTSGTASTAHSGSSSAYAFNVQGNQTENKGATYTWDSSGRLATATSGGTTITYTYDALNRLIQRTKGSTTTRYAYCGSTTSPCAILNSSNTVVDQMTEGIGGTLVTETPGSNDPTLSYPNLQGNYIVTKAYNGSTESYNVTYSPYGQISTASKTPKNPHTSALDEDAFGTVGKLTEATLTTSIVFMGARAYVPNEGRFLSVDPIEGGCANAYVYVRGDPLNKNDLTGQAACNSNKTLQDIGIGLAVIGIVVGVAALITGSPELAAAFGALSVIAGVLAIWSDFTSCLTGDASSCLGAALGVASAIAGVGGVGGALLQQDTLLAGALKGLSGMASNLGLAGTITDMTHQLTSEKPCTG